MFRCFISSILFLALLSCTKNNVEANLLKDSGPQLLTSSSVAEPKLDGYTRTKLNSEVTHVQPMTGIVLWNDNDHKKDSYVQLEATSFRRLSMALQSKTPFFLHISL